MFVSQKLYKKVTCNHEQHTGSKKFQEFFQNITTMTPDLIERKRQRLVKENMSGRKRQINRYPMRIKFNTDALDSGDADSCYNAGTSVMVDNGDTDVYVFSLIHISYRSK